MLKECHDMKEEIKISDIQKFKLYKKHCYLIDWSVEKIQNVKIKFWRLKTEE